jgi:amidohydrolase
VVSHAKHLHAHPELSWAEEKTAAYVEGVLSDLGIPSRRMAGTGVVADLPGRESLPMRALRADLDALATHELTGLPHASTTPGLMHACGHDIHTSVLLGAAEVLQHLEAHRRRPLRLIFQPAEETDPSGAGVLIEEGVLDGVGDIIGLHVWPSLPTGTVGLREGLLTAAADQWQCTLRGPGGHTARPHETVDLVPLAARVIGALVDLPRARFDPVRQLTLVSVGTIHGGEAFNVLPDTVTFSGTLRTLDPLVRPVVSEAMEMVARSICESAGATVEWVYTEGVPPAVNHPILSSLAREVVTGLFGPEAAVSIDRPSMGAEDFAHYTTRVPGFLFRLGSTPHGAEVRPLHSSHFEADPAAAPVGVAVLAGLALV